MASVVDLKPVVADQIDLWLRYGETGNPQLLHGIIAQLMNTLPMVGVGADRDVLLTNLAVAAQLSVAAGDDVPNLGDIADLLVAEVLDGPGNARDPRLYGGAIAASLRSYEVDDSPVRLYSALSVARIALNEARRQGGSAVGVSCSNLALVLLKVYLDTSESAHLVQAHDLAREAVIHFANDNVRMANASSILGEILIEQFKESFDTKLRDASIDILSLALQREGISELVRANMVGLLAAVRATPVGRQGIESRSVGSSTTRGLPTLDEPARFVRLDRQGSQRAALAYALAASGDEDQLVREGDVAGDYLEKLLDVLDYDGDIDLDVEAGRAIVSIDGGEDLERLVGDRGAVLEALQELTRLAVQQASGSRSRLMLDIAGWRQARRDELTEQGLRTAKEVLETGESVRLRPMTPFERKVVHDAVARVKGVTSESEGEEPRRQVVIFRPK